MPLLTEFAKINKHWPKKSIKIPYGELSKLDSFEIGYFTASGVPFRCFSIKINPADDHLKDVALLYNSTTKQFISLLNSEDGFVLTLFENSEEIESHIIQIQESLDLYRGQFKIGKW